MRPYVCTYVFAVVVFEYYWPHGHGHTALRCASEDEQPRGFALSTPVWCIHCYAVHLQETSKGHVVCTIYYIVATGATHAPYVRPSYVLHQHNTNTTTACLVLPFALVLPSQQKHPREAELPFGTVPKAMPQACVSPQRLLTPH